MNNDFKFKNMSPTELHNFNLAMKAAQAKEAKEKRDSSWRDSENERLRQFKQGLTGKLNAKPVEAEKLRGMEDKLVQNIREFQMLAPTMSAIRKDTELAKIKETSNIVTNMQMQRDYYEESQTLLNKAPVIDTALFGEDSPSLASAINLAYNRRNEDELPTFNPDSVNKSLSNIGNVNPEAEAPAGWQAPPE